MRLSDHMLAECGQANDIEKLFTNMAPAIREAERFELTDDVAIAAYNLTKSKPTTLLSALPLVRAPYRKMWFEWRGGLTSKMVRPENKRNPISAPDPLKQGCLVEADATGQRGFMTFCWIHKHDPKRVGNVTYSPVNVSPLGTLFNWQEGANVKDDAKVELARRYPTPADARTPRGLMDLILTMRYTRDLSDAEARAWMERSAFHKWGAYASNTNERKALVELGRHMMPIVTPHALDFFGWCAKQAMRDDKTMQNFLNVVVHKSWEMDIEGEPPFIETVVAMMNSRQCVEHRAVDLSALNKARAKNRRPLFLPYQTTHLRLSQAQTRAMRAGLLSREDAGKHRVRGHFKIRKTGVYWWSPFFRGDPAKPVQRQEYKVVT